MRVPGFSGKDPTFLAVVAGLGVTYGWGPRPWGWECCRPDFSELFVLLLPASAAAVLVLNPRSRLAWVVGAVTAVLTWRMFAWSWAISRTPWIYRVAMTVGESRVLGRRWELGLVAFHAMHLAVMVGMARVVRRDLGVVALAARVGAGLVGAVGVWAVVWGAVPLRAPLRGEVLRWGQVGAFLLSAVVTPGVVWRLVLARARWVEWVCAGAGTPVVGAGMLYCARLGEAPVGVAVVEGGDESDVGGGGAVVGVVGLGAAARGGCKRI